MLSGQIISINKPYRWTSFDVVKKMRGALLRKAGNGSTEKKMKLKVGHAGTLDPLATGLLIICTGSMTKKIDAIQSEEKEYTGTFTFGATRVSYDLETEVDQYFDYNHLNESLIRTATSNFLGTILQTPPAHSAVKVEGVRAYKKARKGEAVDIKPKTIYIQEFEIVSVNLPDVHFRVVCSKGTYIRSLANDFGKYLQSGAYLSNLCRTRIGQYRLADAYSLEDFLANCENTTSIA